MTPVYGNGSGEPRTEEARRPIATGRLMTGLSQEEMAERLHVDVRTLRRYETGELPTPDEVMLEAASAAGEPYLLYWHFREKYRIPDSMMPPVQPTPLAVAVVNLLSELEKLERTRTASRLLELARDGVIDPGEETAFRMIMETLDGVRQAVELLRYSRR